MNFCLGGKGLSERLKSERLKGWVFTLDLSLGSNLISVSRDTAHPRTVTFEGDFSDLHIQPYLNKETKYGKWYGVGNQR